MAKSERIDCLDGLRGIAAIWVLVGHAHLLSGFRVPVIGDPDLGVDLFIMLSGFLMVFHYQLRKEREPWESTQTWRFFWIRRFFRIAPLYYVMLVIALTLGPYLYDSRLVIDAFRHATLQPPERYLDGTLTNYSTHISFIFGLLPQYAFRTPLPDWSIGLEMQFYAVLPFLMLLIGRLGWIKGTVMIAVAGTVIAVIVSRLGVQFPMPAFLPLKMHMFAAGMLVAAALWMDGKKALLCLAVALAFALVPIGGGQGHKYEVVRLGLTLMFFGLVHARRLPLALGKPVRSVSDLLGSRFCHQLGELSFGVYLLHLLIMQPVMAYLIKNDQLSHVALYLVTLAIVVPTAYALAWVGYNFVEVQGQRVGRLLTKPAVVAV